MPTTSGAEPAGPARTAGPRTAGPALGSPPEPTARELATVRRLVLRSSTSLWRDLPWRSTRDPWSVLVSEVMLQQTQASRVVEPFTRFVARFPTVAECAVASVGAVVRAWAGLGYNRRALNLHRAAVLVVDRHAGRVPDQLDDLLRLPGVGPYTARAVLALAYGRRIGVVDTNVSRVLSRAVVGHKLEPQDAQRLADRLVPARNPWLFTQALFDLGARCCTAHAPRCGSCPLASRCRWAEAEAAEPANSACKGTASGDPARAVRRQPPFAGSDREGRGRLVGVLRSSSIAPDRLAAAAGWPGDEARARRIAEDLVSEGLACWRGGELALR